MPLMLTTRRLLLRPFQEADLQPFVAYRSDPTVARYQGWDAPYNSAQAAAFIEEMRQAQPGTPGQWYQVAIALRATGELIGDCAFQIPVSEPRQAEIGVTQARAFQGQGYATEALQRLLAHLFEEKGLNRVVALCDEENTASARLLERLGMRREGHFRENVWFKGRWASEYSYGLLRQEWLARQATTATSAG